MYLTRMGNGIFKVVYCAETPKDDSAIMECWHEHTTRQSADECLAELCAAIPTMNESNAYVEYTADFKFRVPISKPEKGQVLASFRELIEIASR